MFQRGGPLWQQVLFYILVPPIMACLWYLLSRGWAGMLGTAKRPRVRGWLTGGFWILLGAMYVLVAAILIYAHFIK